jgi:hypothetical protein
MSGSLWISICNEIPVVQECQSKVSGTWAYFVAADGNCYNVVSSDREQNSIAPIGNRTLGAQDKGISMQAKDSPFVVKVVCNSEQKIPAYRIANYTIIIESEKGCGKVNYLAKTTEENRYKFSLFLLGIGVVLLMVFGCEWNMLIGSLAFISGFGLVWFLFVRFIEFSMGTASVILISVLAAVAGGILAYFCLESELLSLGAPGFAFGVMLTQYTMLIFQITLDQVS